MGASTAAGAVLAGATGSGTRFQPAVRGTWPAGAVAADGAAARARMSPCVSGRPGKVGTGGSGARGGGDALEAAVFLAGLGKVEGAEASAGRGRGGACASEGSGGCGRSARWRTGFGITRW